MSGAYPWTFVLESNDEQPHTLPPASTNTKPVIPPLKITPASNSPPSSSLSKSIPLRNNEGSKKSKAKVTKWKFSGTKSKVHKVGVHFDKHSQYMGNWSGADEESTPSPTSSPNPAITATSPPEIQVRPRSQIRKSMKKAANRSSAPADMAFLTKANRNRNSLSRLSIAAFGSPPTSNTTSPLQSPRYNPTSPLQSPRYNPTSPLQSPRYNTTSPRYSTNSPRFNTNSPRYIQNQSSPVVIQSQTPVLYSNEQPTLVQNFTSNPPSNTQVTRNSNVNSRFIPEPLHRSISMPSGMDRNYQGDIYSQYVNSTTTSNDFAHDDFETLLDSQHYQDGIKIVQPNYYRRVSFSEDSRIDSPGSPMQMSPQTHSSNQVRSSSPGMFTGSPNGQMYYSYEQTQGYHHSGNSMQHLHESSMQHPNYSPFGGNIEPMGDHGNIIVIQNEAEFRRRIKQATGLVVVDWSASWCGPCKRIFPAVVQYSREYPETVFLNVDVDANPDLAAEYDIRAMPTFLFFKNGSVYDKLQGADPNALGEKLEKHQVKSWGSGQRLGGTMEDTPPVSQPSPIQASPQPVSQLSNTGDGVGDVLLSSLLEMGFSFNHARKALQQTNNVGLEQAIDWISTHPETDDDSSDVPCEDVTNSDDVPMEDSEPPKPEESWEVREARIKEKLRAAKEARKKREEEADRQRELNRIKNATGATLTNRAIEEQKRKDDIAAAKKKRKEEREAKNAIRAKIQAAKEERMKKDGMITTLDSPSTTSKSSTKKESKTETKKEYTVCSLAIRCPNGKTIKHDFAPNDTLKTVYDYLRTEGGLTGDFIISTNYPRIAYTGDKLNITLEYADLVPRAALTVSYK